MEGYKNDTHILILTPSSSGIYIEFIYTIYNSPEKVWQDLGESAAMFGKLLGI